MLSSVGLYDVLIWKQTNKQKTKSQALYLWDPFPHRVHCNSKNEALTMANSSNLGYSVGSWKELACTWSDSCPGKTRDSACPGPAKSWSTETPCCGLGCWLSSVCSEHMKQRTDSETQQCSAVCSETSLTLTFGFRGIPGSSLPCYRPADHLPGQWECAQEPVLALG